MNRESLPVELVDLAGTPVGTATVAAAHQPPGALHRAFSVVLADRSGRVLLQRRAAVKTRFPLLWANTCCGHPEPGTPPAQAATRRLGEELGVTGIDLVDVGVYPYQAADPGSGLVEHEYDHVLAGTAPGALALAPDPAEVAEVGWFDLAEVRAAIASTPRRYVPWLAGVLAVYAAGSTGAG